MNKAVTRVADERGAGIADQRNGRAAAQPFHQSGDLPAFVVLMQRDQRRADAEMRQQRAGMSRVFSCDQIDLPKHRKRPR